ncbi:MAG: BirA family biotin operon repressor/biotin-[acetyl-CoA-carboxylase] ligase [Phenylobacterium sp.]|jgi:BirA family biotin operon repressor/biotin-[acetyl-CoA-carboxylase] ligase
MSKNGSSEAKKQIILNCLSDGHFHSGEKLGQLLGITRSAVGKHIKGLTELGIEVFSIQGKGYCLAEHLQLLSKQDIESHYQTLRGGDEQESRTLPSIVVEHVTASTNETLLQKIRANSPLSNGDTVVAECQTAGRGRRGRAWISPFGAHIYFSMYWQFEGIQQAMGLSLAVGLAVRAAIAPLVDSSVKVKWPNDLLIEQQKLAGILIELEGQADGPCGVVIGIGINVNMPQQQAEKIDQPWTEINSHCSDTVDRNKLIARLIYQLKQTLVDFEQNGLQTTHDQWQQHDHYYDKPITLVMGSRQLSGLCKGIDRQGGVLLQETDKDITSAYYGGEISLRPQS